MQLFVGLRNISESFTYTCCFSCSYSNGSVSHSYSLNQLTPVRYSPAYRALQCTQNMSTKHPLFASQANRSHRIVMLFYASFVLQRIMCAAKCIVLRHLSLEMDSLETDSCEFVCCISVWCGIDISGCSRRARKGFISPNEANYS